MQFTKMHGAGNDYVFLDGFRDALPADPGRLARRMANRRFGVGADGLILLEPDPRADFRMRIFNADGSEAEMCGNGLRCAYKYLLDRGRVRGERARARTGAGDREVCRVRRASEGDTIGVWMGEPRPSPVGDDDFRCVPIEAGGRRFEAVCVDVGNPHAVVFLEESVAAFAVDRFGPALERHPRFPDRVNVEFAERTGPREVTQRTWERGSGETLACGTGACAVAAAGRWTDRLDCPVTVRLRGGELTIDWRGEGNPIYMEGPAQEVFTGEWHEC